MLALLGLVSIPAALPARSKRPCVRLLSLAALLRARVFMNVPPGLCEVELGATHIRPFLVAYLGVYMRALWL